MPRTFVPNPAAIDELRKHPAVRAAARATAEQVKAKAKDIAPDTTGHYARSLRVVEHDDQVAVATTDVAGHLIEFGSVNNPPYAPLRRAARAAGLRLAETGP